MNTAKQIRKQDKVMIISRLVLVFALLCLLCAGPALAAGGGGHAGSPLSSPLPARPFPRAAFPISNGAASSPCAG